MATSGPNFGGTLSFSAAGNLTSDPWYNSNTSSQTTTAILAAVNANDSIKASCSFDRGSGEDTTDTIDLTNFSLSTSGTINGITVTFDAYIRASSTLTVQLLSAGSAVGSSKTMTSAQALGTPFNLGSASDAWGWGGVSSSLVNASTFGIRFNITTSSNTTTGAPHISINYIKISIDYTVAGGNVTRNFQIPITMVW